MGIQQWLPVVRCVAVWYLQYDTHHICPDCVLVIFYLAQFEMGEKMKGQVPSWPRQDETCGKIWRTPVGSLICRRRGTYIGVSIINACRLTFCSFWCRTQVVQDGRAI